MRGFIFMGALWGAMVWGELPDCVARRSTHLRALIDYHDQLYFREHRPGISDATYDALVRELEALEADWPELVDAGSPTQRVPDAMPAGEEPVAHTAPVLSLKKVHTDEDLRRFLNRFPEDTAFSVEPKVDGVALIVRYEQGELIQALTRGNGQAGMDVTGQARQISGLPERLAGSDWPELLELRGEVYMSKARFEELKHLFSSARNAAAGALLLKDLEEVKSRQLEILFFEQINGGESQQTLCDELARFGLPVPPAQSLLRDEVVNAARHCWTAREGLPYEIDGVVIKVDSYELRTTSGATAHHPRWAVARKYADEVAVTRLLAIHDQVGRTGVITPVAALQPVELNGARITRATLHHYGIIAELDLRIGDRVEISRAGGVIPKIIRVCAELRSGDEMAPQPPALCPSCKTALTNLTCPNKKCPQRCVAALLHFCDRDQMNIRPLGEKRAQQLVESGLVIEPRDLYKLTYEDLISLPGVGEKTAQKLLISIEASRARLPGK
jgi:DNA ligase (NAD+)